MRNKNKRLTAANAFWVLDALVVVILGVRLGSETFYVYSHPEQTELAEHYWITAGEIVADFLPLLIGLTLGGILMTILALKEQKKLPALQEIQEAPSAAQECSEPETQEPAEETVGAAAGSIHEEEKKDT